MNHDIRTMKDVNAFLEQIANEIDDFSLYMDFCNYVFPDSHLRRYTDEEAAIRNDSLGKCFIVCESCAEGALEYIEWYYDLKRLCIEYEHP